MYCRKDCAAFERQGSTLQLRYTNVSLNPQQRRSTAARILRSLCRNDECMMYVGYVSGILGVYVSTIKRNPRSEWHETWYSSNLRDTVEAWSVFGSRGIGSGNLLTFRLLSNRRWRAFTNRPTVFHADDAYGGAYLYFHTVHFPCCLIVSFRRTL